MRNETRQALKLYRDQVARLNGVDADAVASKFAVSPQVQQTMEAKIQETSEFLKSINVIGVIEQEGEALGLMITGPIAGTQDTTTGDRETRDLFEIDGNRYRCEQINYDTHLKYSILDAWAKFPQFQQMIRDAILQRIALDRIMVGFNGNSRAVTSNRATNPLLQDVGVGWLQKIRANAPSRWMKEVVPASGKIKVGPNGDYKTLDAVVYDAVNNLIAPWYREDTQLVAICGSALLADKYFPLVNTVQAPTEQKAAQDLISSQKRIGNRQAVSVPFFPPNAILITKLSNISVYWQEGAQRRSVMDNPKRDRVETYQSSNDSFVIEDYECVALIENIELE